jgi:hypothetical protein
VILATRPTATRATITTFGFLAALATLGTASNGCRKDEAAPARLDRTPVVARVGESTIFARDLAAHMRTQGLNASRALDQLVTFELLARAASEDAASAATATDAADAERLRNLEIQRLIEREIEPQLVSGAIDEAEVRSLYDRARPRFVHGRLVQVALLCVFTGARMKAEPRARAGENARKLKAYLDSRRGTAAAARESSPAAELELVAADPAWIERKVTFTTVWQGADSPFPAVVGKAVQTLAKPGDTTELVGDETGFYIARYLSEKPPENVPFEEAAPRIREEMYEPWRRRRFLQLSLALAQGHDIQVFPENLSKL